MEKVIAIRDFNARNVKDNKAVLILAGKIGEEVNGVVFWPALGISTTPEAYTVRSLEPAYIDGETADKLGYESNGTITDTKEEAEYACICRLRMLIDAVIVPVRSLNNVVLGYAVAERGTR